jgi:hypothetical protein
MPNRLAVQLSLVLALAMPAIALAQSSASTAQVHEATIDDVYKAAQSGHFSDADGMMARVLTAHPDSAKAHFVHSELLAKEGRLPAAKAEYAKANELAPGLPFAKPEAVAGLLQRFDTSTPARVVESATRERSATTSTTDFSSGLGTPAKFGIAIVLLAAAVFLFRRSTGGRSPVAATGMNAPAGFAAPYYGNGGYGSSVANPVAAPATATTGLGGALMTGAAMGLGAVAVEEAVRRFSHRDDRTDDEFSRRNDRPAFANSLAPDTNADMGGNDFGIADAGSWDGGGGGVDSNSDW